MDPLIVNAALTGIVPTRAASPHVPLTPAEIVADARRVRDAGASIVHLHAREPDERASHRKEVYAEIVAGVRAACPELIVCVTCSGRVHGGLEERAQVLELEPDLASLTLGSLNFPTGASVNAPETIEALAQRMRARGILPELELFDVGMADYAVTLVARGVLAPPHYANVLLGNRGTLAATAENLLSVVRALPVGTTWSAAGIGRFQHFVTSLAVVLGGHVRVGLEDALYYDWDTKELATNAGLVDRVVTLARAAGRAIATPEQARRIIGLGARS